MTDFKHAEDPENGPRLLYTEQTYCDEGHFLILSVFLQTADGRRWRVNMDGRCKPDAIDDYVDKAIEAAKRKVMEKAALEGND